MPPCLLAVFFFSADISGTFGQTVYPVLEGADCRSCHNSDGVASATRLQFPEHGASPGVVESFGKGLGRLGPLLLSKPTNRVPHAGGERIKPNSAEANTLKAWVDRLATLAPAEIAQAQKEFAEGGAPARARPALRRLTHTQYNNTVRDLLKDPSAPANQFPPEDFVNGFKNQYESQSVSPLLMESYSAAAERLARSAFRNGDSRGLIGCRPSADCRSRFVASFGLKAFRRPLTPQEHTRYGALFASQSDFLSGTRLTVEAMLQSPHFLFRLEESPNPKWKAYATASRLAYALWDTMPGDALLAAAGRGDLDTVAGVEKTVRVLLSDAKARQALDEFVSQWLRFDRILTAAKDRRKFPAFTRETAFAMTGEARQFAADLVWNNRNFMELFTSEHGYLNGDLAGVYGLPAPAVEFERVAFPADSGRAGILGQALFLAMTAKPDDTSPTARGLFVREQFLCQHVADPPPGVSTNLPPLNEAKPQTNRDRLAMHTTNAGCAGCHNLVDPIGFGFEKFDAIGARRDKATLEFVVEGEKNRDEKRTTVSLPLDTRGWVAGIKSSEFSSPKELGSLLARTPVCQECIVKQYFRWITGSMETQADRALIREVTEDFRRSDFRFQEMIVSLMIRRERTGLGGTDVAHHH